MKYSENYYSKTKPGGSGGGAPRSLAKFQIFKEKMPIFPQFFAKFGGCPKKFGGGGALGVLGKSLDTGKLRRIFDRRLLEENVLRSLDWISSRTQDFLRSFWSRIQL